jgi:hypothetical protein
MIRTNAIIGSAVMVVTILASALATPQLSLLLNQEQIQQQMAYAISDGTSNTAKFVGGTISSSGDHVYAVWWTNKSGDWEVMFRASSDHGHTFGPKINLSNSTGLISNDASISSNGKDVYVIWWEGKTTATRDPVLRFSNDNGKTFGEKIMLSSSGTSTNTG